jgi:hypothetical protein
VVLADEVGVNTFGSFNGGEPTNIEAVSVQYDMNTVTFAVTNVETAAIGPFGLWHFAGADSNGADFRDSGGDIFQIIPRAMDDGPVGNGTDPAWGTLGNYNIGDLDISCETELCGTYLQAGLAYTGTGGGVLTNTALLGPPPQDTPEMSTGASLAVGLLLSSWQSVHT